jgi:hypothetical protein
MMDRWAVSIPVARRWIPESSTIGVAAWLAAFPIAFLAATALVPGQRILVTVLVITSMLGAKTLTTAGSARDRRRGVAASWLLIAVAAAAISHEILAVAGFHAPVVACAVGALAGGLYVRAIAVARPSAHEALDARALALEPVATWLAVSALQDTRRRSDHRARPVAPRQAARPLSWSNNGRAARAGCGCRLDRARGRE